MATKVTFDREQRVAQLKICGQSIIDNAERIYNDFKYSADLEIIISVASREPPIITVKRSFYPETLIESLQSNG